MYSLNSFSISRLNNAEITAFFINLQRALNDADPDNLPVSADLQSSYGTTLQKLIDQVYNSTASEFTAAMKAADDKRDLIYRRIQLKLKQVSYLESSDTAYSYKDTVEAEILGKYGANVPMMAYQEETAIIKGFIYDVQNKLSTAGMQALGVSADITALEDANQAFIDAYNSRTNEKAAGDTGLTAELRNTMIGYYQQITYAVLFYANNTETANAAKAAESQTFLALINVLLADAKKRYNVRTGNSDESDDSTDDASTDATADSATDSTDSSASTSDSSGSSSGSTSGSTSTGDGKFVDGVYMVE